MISKSNILGVVLAGGQGRRLGFVNKPLIKIGAVPNGGGTDDTVLSHIMARLRPQVGRIIINANAEQTTYARYADTVIADSVDGFLGPLAGVLTALDWAALHTNVSHIITLPGDAPFIPRDLVARFITAHDAMTPSQTEDRAVLVRATSGGRAHPVVGLWPVAIRADLRDGLINQDIRKIDRFTANYAMADVNFDGVPDPFFNINTDDDVAQASRIIAGAVSPDAL